MKKFHFTLMATLLAFTLSAQEIWLEAALKGGYGASFLLNQNVFDDDNTTYQVNPMYNFGGKVALNFGPFNGIAVEGLMTKAGGKFENSDLVTKVEWNSLDAYLLYRHIRSRVYLELGPMVSFVRSVDHTTGDVELPGQEVFYEKNYLAGVFGFGGYIAGSETFSVGLGIRLHYGLTDFVNENGQKLFYPASVPAVEPAITRPAYGEVMVEFNFGIGHWARTSCSKRMQFFGSGR